VREVEDAARETSSVSIAQGESYVGQIAELEQRLAHRGQSGLTFQTDDLSVKADPLGQEIEDPEGTTPHIDGPPAGLDAYPVEEPAGLPFERAGLLEQPLPLGGDLRSQNVRTQLCHHMPPFL